jgi:type I restriction enzyme S subunit
MKKYKLGEIATIQTGPFGSQLHNEDYVIKGTPIVTVEHLGNKYFITQNLPLVSDEDKERLKKYLLKENDIVFSRVGAVDRCSFVSEKENGWLFSGRCLRVRPNKEVVNSQWLYYFFTQQHFKEYVRSKAVGCTMPSLNTDLLSDLIITTPPLESQQKIAAVLSSLDDKIALNRRMNAKLEQMAKRLYDHWFVQFDFPVPCHSELVSESHNKEMLNQVQHDERTKPYKASGGKMVWNETLKREIPAGWEVVCFADFIEIGNGKDHSKLPTGNIPVYGSGGFMRGVTNFLYDGESVLFPRKGTLNNIMYKNEKFWTVDTMFYSKMKISHSAIYVYYTAKQFDFVSMNTGTGVPSMTSVIIKGLPIIKPTQDILDSYDESIQPIYKKIHQNEKETQKLTALRDRLLPLLMNGQVEVE